jgi:RNA polymerase sigma-70 factor (family 1)
MIRTYTDDTHLWADFLRGEPSAERQVFHRFFKPLCLYAERITGQLEAAEDIVAEAFTKAWARRRDFEAIDNGKAFLYTIVRNASLNFTAAARQHQQAHLQIAYLEGQEKELEPALEREILRVELLQEIYEEMDNLPDRCGQVFKRIFIYGQSTEQIAAELGMSPQTVRTQKARAIRLIQIELLRKNRISALLLLMALLEAW